MTFSYVGLVTVRHILMRASFSWFALVSSRPLLSMCFQHTKPLVHLGDGRSQRISVFYDDVEGCRTPVAAEKVRGWLCAYVSMLVSYPRSWISASQR